MKIVTVVGARPQFIKAAAVSREITNRPEITEIIVHTGQHYDDNMSDVFFREMRIPAPQYCLNINAPNHGAMTGRMLEGVEEVLLKERPDFVMVYGDTNTTLAGALAAKKIHQKVVHVEAGLRSFNLRMPEEINRILTDRISDLLCCPTDKAVKNLLLEGFAAFQSRIVKTGDVMEDAIRFYSGFSAGKSDIMIRLHLEGEDFLLCTLHRAENTDDLQRLRSVIAAFNEISKEMRIVFPVHPRTAKILETSGIIVDFELLPPVGYFEMIELLKRTSIVLTDSGGLQKEAYFLGKPCVTLRDETEWGELVEGGFNFLAGTDKDKILAGYRTMLGRRPLYIPDLYGEGNASRKVVDELLRLV